MEEITISSCPFCGNTQIDYWDETDGFFYCEACGLCGPRAHDKILAADRWNGLPRRLKWTREKPTKNGWYWWRTGGDCNLRGIVSVCIETDIMVLAGSYKYLSQTTGEWAGPIPEPEEA